MHDLLLHLCLVEERHTQSSQDLRAKSDALAELLLALVFVFTALMHFGFKYEPPTTFHYFHIVTEPSSFPCSACVWFIVQ